MAKAPRSKANGNQSIVRHPLFPATVALWFGALFGLGSLAIRPGLLETAVVAIRLDALIASAAPPLGATTRILVALFMAGAGGLLGAMLARRIARPRPVVVPRKRGAGAVGNAHKASRSSHYVSGNAEASTHQSGAGNRRRQLAIEEEPATPPEYRDQVPVPGGAPQILDVSTFDLDGFETVEQDDPEPAEAYAAQAPGPWDSHGAAPSGPAASAPGDFSIPAGAQVFQPAASGEGGLETPLEPRATGPSPALANGLFDSYSQGLEANPPLDPSSCAPAPLSAPAGTGIAEEVEPEVDFAALPRLGGQAADPGWLEETPKPHAPFHRPALEFEPAPRLFGQDSPKPNRPAPSASEFDQEASESIEIGGKLSAPFEPPQGHQIAPFGSPNGQEHPQEPDDHVDAPDFGPSREDVSAGRDMAEAPACPSAVQSAGERIETAKLDDLSDVELLERLARTLERRRSRSKTASAPTGATAEAAGPLTRADFAASQEASDAAAPFAPPAPPPPVAIPAALRPIGLDEEDDADLLPAYVPPRRIAMPQDPADSFDRGENEADAAPPLDLAQHQLAEDEGGTFPTLAGPRQAEAEEANAAEESRVLEEGYSSLLDLSRRGEVRQQFVRVEEPDFTGGQIEPVVVFPGQEPVRDASFAPPPASEGLASATGSAGHANGQPAPFAPPAGKNHGPAAAPFGAPQKRQDPEETERALRTALATLQRMSGAA